MSNNVISKIQLPNNSIYDLKDSNAKRLQNQVLDPIANGNAISFIDTISQNEEGIITPTKKNVPNASQSIAGLMSANDKKKLDGITSGATANTGTVTNIATGVGLTGGTITESGTLKVKLRSETALTIDSAAVTTTSGRVYPVAVDKTGYLAVNVPWTDNNTTYSAGTGLSLSGTTFSNSGVTSVNGQTGAVSITPANIGAVAVGDGSTNASINQELINGARSFVLHSYGGTYPHVGAIFKETGLQLWDYTNGGSELWWFPKIIGIPQGGTGATTPAGARANLEITPENIGAVNKAGDTMTGDLNFAHSNMLVYGAEDTRRWLLYPNRNQTEFYCATQEKINGEWATWTDVWRAHSDGTIELNQPLAVTSGGTGAITPAGARTNLGITPENIGAFKQIPGYVTRAMLDDYNIKYWYGGRVIASDAVAIGLPAHEWFVLNMSKDDDTDSSWTRQVFYQLGGPMIFERTCSYHTWSSPTMVGVPVSLNQHDGSREIVLAEISKVEPGYTAPIFITSDGCSLLTGGKRSLYLSGTITRSTPTSIVIMAGELSPATAIYTWRVDNLLDTGNWSFGAITKYTGTIV